MYIGACMNNSAKLHKSILDQLNYIQFDFLKLLKQTFLINMMRRKKEIFQSSFVFFKTIVLIQKHIRTKKVVQYHAVKIDRYLKLENVSNV